MINNTDQLVAMMLLCEQMDRAKQGAMACIIMSKAIARHDDPLQACRELLEAKPYKGLTPELLLGRIYRLAGADALAYVNKTDHTVNYANLLEADAYQAIEIPEFIRAEVYEMMGDNGISDVAVEVSAELDKIAAH